ncbi:MULTISPECIES: hypothetical protein [Bradyrhizobium]|uniref:hypothetical protein n=1 Tax=Bradyrhizobium TaxID=374 RepID=UPI001BA91CA1|nr:MULTISPECIES: hypothetical protein [Bradyrhizobium]MBR1364702.1 hypothetical protein [Bradyrhizobium ottawaense]
MRISHHQRHALVGKRASGHAGHVSPLKKKEKKNFITAPKPGSATFARIAGRGRKTNSI